MKSNKKPSCRVFLCYRDGGAEIAKNVKTTLDKIKSPDYGHIWYSDLEKKGNYIDDIPFLIPSAEYAIIFFSEKFTAGFLKEDGKINYSKDKHDSGCVTVREIIQIEKCRQAGTLTVIGVHVNGYRLTKEDKEILDSVFHEAGIYTDRSIGAYTELNGNDYHTRTTDVEQFCGNLYRAISENEDQRPHVTKTYTDALTPPLTYECFGRDEEIRELNRLYKEKSCINLYAPHGSGKSSLVFHWLSSIAADGYNGAEFVFCWQFYGETKKYSIPENLNDFFEKLIDFLGIKDVLDGTGEVEKATAIAEFMKRHPTILVLDNMDALIGYENGGDDYITNVAMHQLIKLISLNKNNDNGLLILMSSNRISELQYYPQNTAIIQLKPMSEADCVSTLRHLGVLGSDKDLRRAVQELNLNPLAISLMGKIIVNKYNKNINERYRISYSNNDTKRLSLEPIYSMYDDLWPITSKEGRILLICCLFRNRIDLDALDYILRNGETFDFVSDITSVNISATLDLFKRSGLVYGDGEISFVPAIKEYYRKRFAKDMPEEYREINLSLAKYLSGSCDDRFVKSLEDLSPLYDAIYHYTLADEPKPAVDILWNRVFRKRSFFSQKQLGAISNDLCAASFFFDIDKDWSPNPKLDSIDTAWLTSVVAYLLNSMGDLSESEKLRKRELKIYKSIGAKRIYASDVQNLARNLMLQGRLDESEAAFAEALEVLNSEGADITSPYTAEIDENTLRANIIAKYAFLLYLIDDDNYPKALQMIKSLDVNILKDHTTSLFYYCYLTINTTERCESLSAMKSVKKLIVSFNKNKKLEAAYANLLSAMIEYMQITPLNFGAKFKQMLVYSQAANEIANITGRNDQLPFILNKLLEMYINVYKKAKNNKIFRDELLKRISETIGDFEEIDSMYRIPLYRVEFYSLKIKYYCLCLEDRTGAIDTYEKMRSSFSGIGYFKRKTQEIERLLSDKKYL